MGINPLVQDLKQIKSQLEIKSNIISKPVPQQWEDFVSLCTIRSGGRMVKFTPFLYQSLLSRLMDEYSNIVIVKSRQLGCTQVIASRFLHRACLSEAYSSMCFLRSQEDASAIARRTRQMLDGVKEYVKPVSDNVGYLKLQTLGEIYFKNSSKEGSRSYDSVLDFLFDEAGFSENIEQIYAASSPSGALAGDLITKLIISTPSAKSGWYWNKLNENNGSRDVEELCKLVASGKIYRDIPGCFWWVDELGTVKLILHWKCHPIYSQREDYLQYRQQQDGTDWETVLREYDLRFVDSAVSVFAADFIRTAAVGELEDFRDKEARYYLGIDVSTIGLDYTVAIILKEKKGRYSTVALYRRRQQTAEYHLYQIGSLIKQYQPNKIGIEVTGGVGQVYLERLSKEFESYEFQAIRTTGESKPILISTLQLVLEAKNIEFPESSAIPDELLSFRRVGKRLEAASGKHDDTVLALSFALSIAEKADKGWDLSAIPKAKYE
jgi:phage terminase large subunit-like protein